ncbi:MAG: DUF6328 family protein [Cellulomonadaceae bacterium]
MDGYEQGTPGSADGSSTGRNESDEQRADRNWAELLQELRVTQTGVQVLTAFLLTIPFQARFTELTGSQRTIYLVLVALSLLATGLLVAPVSLHRTLFRRRLKPEIVRAADRLARAGVAVLALVLAGTAMLVADVVVSTAAGVVAAVAVAATLAGLWYGAPAVLSRRVRS